MPSLTSTALLGSGGRPGGAHASVGRALRTLRSEAIVTTGRVTLHVILPLVLGAAMYAAWRSPEIRLVAWLEEVLPGTGGRARSGGALVGVPSAIAGSLPDAAWGWALGAALSLLWRGATLRARIPWLMGGGALAVGTELGQAVHVVPGTFDPLDLAAIGVGYTLGMLIAGRDAASRSPRTSP